MQEPQKLIVAESKTNESICSHDCFITTTTDKRFLKRIIFSRLWKIIYNSPGQKDISSPSKHNIAYAFIDKVLIYRYLPFLAI